MPEQRVNGTIIDYSGGAYTYVGLLIYKCQQCEQKIEVGLAVFDASKWHSHAAIIHSAIGALMRWGKSETRIPKEVVWLEREIIHSCMVTGEGGEDWIEGIGILIGWRSILPYMIQKGERKQDGS